MATLSSGDGQDGPDPHGSVNLASLLAHRMTLQPVHALARGDDS
jgi:hypothetical protein